MARGRKERRGAAGKGRGKAGETMVETLVTMLIIGLSAVLFLTMVGAAGKIFRKAEKGYNELYGKIAEADVQEGALPDGGGVGTITVKGEGALSTDNFTVDWYGNDYVRSYNHAR